MFQLSKNIDLCDMHIVPCDLVCIYPKSFKSSVHFCKAQQLFKLMLVSHFLFFPAPIAFMMVT